MKNYAISLLAIFATSTVFAGQSVEISCNLSRITDGNHRSSKIMLTGNYDEVACLKDPTLSIVLCYDGAIGNFTMSVHEETREQLVKNWVVSKYGSFDKIPERFELNSQTGDHGPNREMVIASCEKN